MRVSRSTGVLSGVLIILLAIWGGIVPFIGPYFHYSFGSEQTWHFTTDRLWLDILPAAVAVLGGLIMVSSSHRLTGVIGSAIALTAGAWFIVGPPVSLVWEHETGPIGTPLYGPTRQAIELVGYFYGVGALITALAAFALGRFVARPAPVATPAAGGTTAAMEPIIAAEPAATTVGPMATPQPEAVTEAAATKESVAPSPTSDSMAPAAAASPTASALQDDTAARALPEVETADSPEAAPSPSPAPVTIRARRGGLLGRFRRSG